MNLAGFNGLSGRMMTKYMINSIILDEAVLFEYYCQEDLGLGVLVHQSALSHQTKHEFY